MKNLWAIIPARGGSKGLPGKNIRLFRGIPLIGHTIQAALGCGEISRCIVTTDSDEISSISKKFGAEVVMRPSKFAMDLSLTQDAVRHLFSLHVAKELPEFFVLLQPTSPLRDCTHLQECIRAFSKMKYNSAISVCRSRHHPCKALVIDGDLLRPLFDERSLSLPRQELSDAVSQNGAIYIANTALFLEKNSFFIPPVMPFLMDEVSSIDIDTEFDLQIAEELLKNKR